MTAFSGSSLASATHFDQSLYALAVVRATARGVTTLETRVVPLQCSRARLQIGVAKQFRAGMWFSSKTRGNNYELPAAAASCGAAATTAEAHCRPDSVAPSIESM